MDETQLWLLEAIEVAGLMMVLWIMVSPISWGLRWLMAHLMPNGPTDHVISIWKRLPGTDSPQTWLSQRLADLRLRLVGSRRIRVGVDGLHRALDARLIAFRADLARDLSVVVQGGSRGSGSVIQLLQDFPVASERAHQFEKIDEDLPDQSQQIAVAKSRFYSALFFSLIIGAVNCGLLLVFFRDVPLGIDIPGTRIDLLTLAAVLLPVTEFATGFLPALLTDEDEVTSLGAKIAKLVTSGALAGLEAIVFFLLFSNIAANILESDSSGQMQTVAPYLPLFGALFGVGMVILQTLAGEGAGKNRLRLKRLKPIKQIKDQVRDANDFVEGLPTRYEQIDRVAVQARQSVKDFLAAVRTQNNQDSPVVGQLEQARDRLLDAIASVDPLRWPPGGPADEGDKDDALRMAWGSVLLLVAPLLFVLLTSWLLMELPFFAASPPVAIAGALGLALGAALLLPGLAPRAALIVEEGTQARLWLPGGGGVEKGIAIGYALLVSIAMLGIGIFAQGWTGLIIAVLALALLAPAAWLGGSLPQLLVGVSFLVQAAIHLAGFALLLGWLVLRALILALVWILATVVIAIASILALPVTFILWLRRRSEIAAPVGTGQ
jgi:hypothetical protein